MWRSACVAVALAAAAAMVDMHPRAAAPQELGAEYWAAEARGGIAARRGRDADAGAARRLALFLGDGMSLPTLTAARILKGQRRGRPGEEGALFFEAFPSVGLVKTYCVSDQIADSACSATAYLCGAKSNSGTVGVTAAVRRRDCAAAGDPARRLSSVAEWALDAGLDVGIVTTTRVTHASPAAAYAKSAERRWESDRRVREDAADPALCPDIAHQLVHHYPGNRFKVILGGGRREFRPNTTRDEEDTQGRRWDGRDLIEEWKEDKRRRNVSHSYVWNREQLMDASDSLPEYLLGLFEGSHMEYHSEANATTEPTLAELTEVAIRVLSRNERGFFLFVEGGRIDHAHHSNRPALALDETLELEAAVRRAAALLPDDDSLLVVTADHSHAMAFNGYADRGADVLGLSGARDDDGVPYMTLSYTNGPGFRKQKDGKRKNFVKESKFGTVRWRAHAEFPLEQETHGGEDVAVFARGPHHALFAGAYEQSQLPHLLAYAACIGPGPRACESRDPL